jgi:RND family efflux transporter MFP subunit
MRQAVVAFAIAAVLTAAAAGIAWQWGRGTPVDVGHPARGPAVEAVYATGTVEPQVWAKMAPTVTGRIRSMAAKEGQAVAEGDVLAQLDDREERARLAEAESRTRFLADEVVRQESLARSGHASRQAVDRAVSESRQGAAAVEALRQKLAEQTLRSPIQGTVLRKEKEVGETVGPGDPLYWIGQCCVLQVNADVDEEDIPRVRVGQRALVKSDAFPDQVIEGIVREITPQGDPVLKVYRVRVRLPEGTPLMVGMTTETNIVIREVADALLVPVEAVAGASLWVAEDGVARRRAAQFGIRGRRMVQVLAGVPADAWVILAPPKNLADGDRVRPTERTAAAP